MLRRIIRQVIKILPKVPLSTYVGTNTEMKIEARLLHHLDEPNQVVSILEIILNFRLPQISYKKKEKELALYQLFDKWK